jgi:nucleotidyltransferase substrate binding protein (TIGR01987 family)
MKMIYAMLLLREDYYESYRSASQSFKILSGYASLQHVMGLLPRYVADEGMYQLLLLSVVQNFELTYETCWKFLRHYIFEKEGLELNSPKAVFRTCGERGLLPADLAAELIMLVDVRNETIHVYDREIAENVVADVVTHAQVFGRVLQLIQVPSEL